MITTDIEQGSEAWHALRCGKATASRIADIVRTTKSGVSASRQRYLGELVSERLTGRVEDGFKSADMKWGSDTEQQARDAYAFYQSARLTLVAFVDHPTIAMSGASPDCLVDDLGLVEIKCPASHTHIATLRDAPIDADYITQMQWQMACTGRAWCDFASFDPRMPPEMQLHVTRVLRDDDMIRKLEKAVVGFLQEVGETVDALQRKYLLAAAA